MPRRLAPPDTQWAKCDRCEQPRPITELRTQRGLLQCSRHLDDLTAERRERIIAEKLAATAEREGSDRLPEHIRWFTQPDEDV